MPYIGEPHFDIPEIPDDLTQLDDRELMLVFSREVAWQNFFAARLTEAQVVEKYAEAELKRTEVRELLAVEIEGKKMSVTEAKAMRDTSPATEKAQQEAINAWARRKAFESAYEARERCAQLYSRELTRRTGGLAIERRDRSWRP